MLKATLMGLVDCMWAPGHKLCFWLSCAMRKQLLSKLTNQFAAVNQEPMPMFNGTEWDIESS